MAELFELLPNPITESELLQLQVGDTFFENDLGYCIQLEMTQAAERNFPTDTGWRFIGKVVAINNKEPREQKEIDYFISDDAGFRYTTVTLHKNYYDSNVIDP